MVGSRYLTLDWHLTDTHSVFVRGKVLLSLQKYQISVLPRDNLGSQVSVTSIFNQTEWRGESPEYSPCLKTFRDAALSLTWSKNLVFLNVLLSCRPLRDRNVVAQPFLCSFGFAWARFHAGKQTPQLADFSLAASGFPPGLLSYVRFSSRLKTVSAAGVLRMTSRVWLKPKRMFGLTAKKISLVPLDCETSLGNRHIGAPQLLFSVSGVRTKHRFQDQQWPPGIQHRRLFTDLDSSRLNVWSCS